MNMYAAGNLAAQTMPRVQLKATERQGFCRGGKLESIPGSMRAMA